MHVVAYLDHPLGEGDGDRTVELVENTASALDWFRFMKRVTMWSIQCPWYISIVAGMGEMRFPVRDMRDRIAVLRRCDIYIMVGGFVSPHMRIHENHCRHRIDPQPVLDLTDLGWRPPWMEIDKVTQDVVRRSRALGVPSHYPQA